MSVYTEQEATELTPEEHAEIIAKLRVRNMAISRMPINTETICLMSDLQLDYEQAGYEANAAALGRRLEIFS